MCAWQVGTAQQERALGSRAVSRICSRNHAGQDPPHETTTYHGPGDQELAALVDHEDTLRDDPMAPASTTTSRYEENENIR